MPGVNVIVDPAKLAAFVRSPEGPVFKAMVLMGSRIQQRARQLVGVSKTNPTGRHLRDTIVKRVVDSASGPVVIVGSSLPYAWFHHEGTRPHVIRPRRAKALAFIWRGAPRGIVGRGRVLGGAYVFFAKVNHPGTPANRFLRNAALEIVRYRGEIDWRTGGLA